MLSSRIYYIEYWYHRYRTLVLTFYKIPVNGLTKRFYYKWVYIEEKIGSKSNIDTIKK